MSRSLPWLLGTALLLSALPGHSQERILRYAGVNLAGAEFNSARRPGTLYKDYTYPAATDYAYFAGQHMNIVRLPFLWERLQPTPQWRARCHPAAADPEGRRPSQGTEPAHHSRRPQLRQVPGRAPGQ